MKIILFLLIFLFSSIVSAKLGIAYTALAYHPATPLWAKYMPNKVDDGASFVRLPLYLAINKEWNMDHANYISQVALFENCYIRPSLTLTHAIKADDLSTTHLSLYLGATLYAREKPQVLVNGKLTQVDDIPLELTMGRYGVTVFPTLIATYQLTEFARVDFGFSGISVLQISWTFGR